MDSKMTEEASNIIIDAEGNKFKAIKEFKDKFNCDNDTATKYITDAFNKINDGIVSEKKEETDPIKEIVIKNDYSMINSVNEVREVFGYGFMEAKELVDKIIEEKEKQDEEEVQEEEVEEVKTDEKPSEEEIKEIYKSNNKSKLNTIDALRNKYGYGFLEAREIVDSVIEE